MNRKNRGLLVGTLLGDSSIHLAKEGNARFQFTHEQKQKDWAFYKADAVFSMFGGEKREPRIYTSKTAYGLCTYYKFSRGHKYMNYLHRVLYNNNGKKFFTRKVLNYLTPEGIAWWYMDDGGVSKGPSKNKFGEPQQPSVEMRISTYCSLEEIEAIIEYFIEVWGIQAKKRYSKKTDSYYLAFNSKESVKLERLIGKFLLPIFEYKKPSFWNTRVQSILSEDDDIV
jgi:hypothetical protein